MSRPQCVSPTDTILRALGERLVRRYTATLLLLGMTSAVSAQDKPLVRIEGGADETGQWYSWRVINQHSSPIVFVEIPHFGADNFYPPEDWEQKCTNLLGVGAKREPGICTAEPKARTGAVRPGASATFKMRLSRAGARRGLGTVTIRFADGTETSVADVEVPEGASRGEKLVVPIVFVLLLAGAIAWQARRRRKTAGAAADTPPSPGEETTEADSPPAE